MAAPVVSSGSPNQGSVSGSTTVTVTGTGFTGATAVRFGTKTATPFTVDSSTQITAVSPAHAAGAAAVTVTTPAGTSNPLSYPRRHQQRPVLHADRRPGHLTRRAVHLR